MKYTVIYTQTVSVTVTVEADDPESVIELADEDLPGTICAHCSGWNENWSRDDDGELVPLEVNDEDGNTVWSRDEGGSGESS